VTPVLYKFRDGEYWVDKRQDDYLVRMGHVVFTMPYPSDEEAIKTVKKAKAAECARMRRI